MYLVQKSTSVSIINVLTTNSSVLYDMGGLELILILHTGNIFGRVVKVYANDVNFYGDLLNWLHTELGVKKEMRLRLVILNCHLGFCDYNKVDFTL
jgi:hypothetical protein